MQQQFPPQPQHPALQQQFQQHPGQQFSVIDALLGEILRAVTHIIAKDMHSDQLDRLVAINDPHALLQVLQQYNDQNEARIKRREHLQKGPGPNAQRPTMPSGKIDSSLEMTRAARALFASKLGGK